MRPKIFVPYDFSTVADAALAWAVDVQRTTKAGPLDLIYAISSRPLGTAEMALETLLPDRDELDRLEKNLREAARQAGADASVRVVIRTSPVGDIILDEAQAQSAELIVMGTHGRSGVKRLFLGSVAEHVVRHATCPVVTVRETADATTAAVGSGADR